MARQIQHSEVRDWRRRGLYSEEEDLRAATALTSGPNSVFNEFEPWGDGFDPRLGIEPPFPSQDSHALEEGDYRQTGETDWGPGGGIQFGGVRTGWSSWSEPYEGLGGPGWHEGLEQAMHPRRIPG